jgi:hypothetical protein
LTPLPPVTPLPPPLAQVMLQLVDDETDPGVRSPLPTPPRRPSPSLRVSSPSSPLRPLPSSAPSARASSPLRPLSSLSFPTAFVGPPSPGEAEIRRAVVQGQDGGHREELTIPVRDYGGRVVALLQVRTKSHHAHGHVIGGRFDWRVSVEGVEGTGGG